MDGSPRLPRSIRSLLNAAAVIGGVAVIWILAVSFGPVDVPACEGGSCGFVVLALLIGGTALLAIAITATLGIVKTSRSVGKALELRRYGRWLSLREGEDRGSGRTNLAVEVEYHDATGGDRSGIEISYVVTGRDPVEAVRSQSTVITDSSGVGVIPVHVSAAPAIVTVRVGVPSNPAVKGATGVFLVGVGSGTGSG
jgi:hypothetical protein